MLSRLKLLLWIESGTTGEFAKSLKSGGSILISGGGVDGPGGDG